MESTTIRTSRTRTPSLTSISSTSSVHATPPTSPRRDDEFYCRDVVFLVEDVLFKVPRRPFERDSIAFRGMFDLPSGDTDVVEGTDDDRPIRLESTMENEFRALLSVIYRPSYGAAKSLSKDQWVSVLKLASLWEFEAIREQAVTELAKLVRDPVSRIALARGYRITGWMEPAITTLAQQESISSHDLEKLGWDTVAKLYQVRESIVWGGSCTCSCNYCNVAHGPITPDHAHTPHTHGGGARSGFIKAATLRRSYDFSQKIREVFGTDLY